MQKMVKARAEHQLHIVLHKAAKLQTGVDAHTSACDSSKTAGSGVARQTMLEDVHNEQTDSLPPSNMGMVFMKNSLEATWSASKTQMSSDPGTRVPGGYIWEHTLLMFPDLPFISPAPDSNYHCHETNKRMSQCCRQ